MIKKIITHIYNLLDDKVHLERILVCLKKKKIKTVFDVGAHIGEFAVKVEKNLDTISKIYSFEPQKEQYIKLNKLTSYSNKIKTFNYGLSERESTKKIKINSITTTSTFSKINYDSKWYKLKNLLLFEKDSFSHVENVKVVTLDFLISSLKIKKIDLLKIDTEGHELNVLNGCVKSFKKRIIKNILIEIDPKSSMYLNYSPSKIHSFLSKSGFILEKKFKFPFHRIEDRLYVLK